MWRGVKPRAGNKAEVLEQLRGVVKQPYVSLEQYVAAGGSATVAAPMHRSTLAAKLTGILDGLAAATGDGGGGHAPGRRPRHGGFLLGFLIPVVLVIHDY